MKYEDLVKANKTIKTTNIKGKEYAEVNQRIKAFRMLYPNGSIITEIVKLDEGMVVMRAKIIDNAEAGAEVVLATGTAYEREKGVINSTSFIENCETSAVGRALGFLGIGVDDSMASADELVNAITQQDSLKSKISEKEQKVLLKLLEDKGVKLEKALNGMKLEDVTGEIYLDAIKKLSKLKDVY